MNYVSYTMVWNANTRTQTLVPFRPKIDLVESNNLCTSEEHNSQLYILRNIYQANKFT